MSSKNENQEQLTPDTFKVLLKKLAQVPDDFTPEDVAQCFRHLCRVDGKGATDAQVRQEWRMEPSETTTYLYFCRFFRLARSLRP